MNRDAEGGPQHCSPRLSQCLLCWHSAVTPDTLWGVLLQLESPRSGYRVISRSPTLNTDRV